MCEKRDIPADPSVQAVVDQYLSKLEEGMKEVIGELDCELARRKVFRAKNERDKLG